MSLFACIGLASLFLVGRRIGGTALGVLACVVHASFYPQAFFSRFPRPRYSRRPSSSAASRRSSAGRSGRLRRGRPTRAPRGLALGGVLPLPGGRAAVRRAGPRRDVGPARPSGFPTARLARSHGHDRGLRLRGAASPTLDRHPLRRGASARPAAGGRSAPSWPTALARRCRAGARGRGRRGAPRARRAAAGPRGSPGSARGRGRPVLSPPPRYSAPSSSACGPATWRGTLVDRVVHDPRAPAAAGRGRRADACPSGRRGAGGRGHGAWRLSFFAGPALCYVIDPMVVPLQPWAMRRFVPMVFPLLFLLALSGWQAGLRRAWGAAPASPSAALPASPSSPPPLSSARRSRLAGPVGRGARRPARRGWRGRSLRAPSSSFRTRARTSTSRSRSQYAHGSDVLLLPLGRGRARRGRGGPAALPGPADRRRAQRVRPAPEADGPLRPAPDALRRRAPPRGGACRSTSARFVAADTFPEPPFPSRWAAACWRCGSPGPRPATRTVSVGDPREDAAILVSGFHDPEVEVRRRPGARPFRWTGPLARMAFTTTAAVELTVDPSRPAPAEPAAVEMRGRRRSGHRGARRGRVAAAAHLPPRLDGPPRKRILSLRARALPHGRPRPLPGRARARRARLSRPGIDP